jgi:hypothetical protein
MKLRMRAAYNTAKSFVLDSYMPATARVLDLGCGNGVDLLKFNYHRPETIVLVDNSPLCLTNAEQFAHAKHIRSPCLTLYADVFRDDVLMVAPGMIINMTLTTTFSLLEYCPHEQAMDHLCHLISQALAPGGIWLGCMTDGDQLLSRCDPMGTYRDVYCEIQLEAGTNCYRIKPAEKEAQLQFLWSFATIQRLAGAHGLVLIMHDSLVNILGTARRNANYDTISRASQLNGKYRLWLHDIRSLSLLSFFAFVKPMGEVAQ